MSKQDWLDYFEAVMVVLVSAEIAQALRKENFKKK